METKRPLSGWDKVLYILIGAATVVLAGLCLMCLAAIGYAHMGGVGR